MQMEENTQLDILSYKSDVETFQVSSVCDIRIILVHSTMDIQARALVVSRLQHYGHPYCSITDIQTAALRTSILQHYGHPDCSITDIQTGNELWDYKSLGTASQ
ncbi:hypothetical protein CHS0354_036998 [Potamilus streckersoni]|uniref:Uncharacterized protein n=1 Tax=Potamilus streckersoni TaxID=2493646 RepID=A0AAE0VXD4_9BIVA|nr:hypothetical protein CHS0354_036998 [Potamilus streckersoni]